MGYTCIPNYHGTIQDKIHHVTKGYPSHIQCLSASNVQGTIYAAMHDHKTGQTWCLVVPHFMSQGQWCYKEQTDDMGPTEIQCPKSVLKLLTVTDNKYANEWRQKCHANNARSMDKIQTGDVVETVNPLSYSFDDEVYEIKRFEFIKGYRFWALDDNDMRLFTVKMPKNWKKTIPSVRAMLAEHLIDIRQYRLERKTTHV